MCFEVRCGTCGKTTWGGCGKHVASVYQGIAEGQHCMCRDWPGVTLPNVSRAGASAATGKGKTDESDKSSSKCN